MLSRWLFALALPACLCAQDPRVAWNRPQEPFRIFGNTYFAGTHGLSAILITSDEGHVLIDGALPESVAQIAANIRKLGFKLEDIKLILNSHAHYDHAGGIAELQRLTGAKVAASAWSAPVLAQGGVGKGDPQEKILPPIDAVRTVATFRFGEVQRVGSLEVTPHATPGHTPGGTGWTWRSCEGQRCLNLVYMDSLTAVSGDEFKFTRDYPDSARDFETSFAFLEGAACDILLTPHPEIADLWGRKDRGNYVDTGACKALAQRLRAAYQRRIDSEKR